MSSGDQIALASLGVAVVAVAATLFNPQFQKWWRGRALRSAPITLGSISPAKPLDIPLSPGVVKADTKTLKDLQEALPSSNIEWLHLNDFGNAFQYKMVEKIESFNWRHKGPQHEFLDPELEKMRLDLRNSTENLIHLANRYTSYVDHDSEFRRIPDQHNDKNDRIFLQKAAEINDAAEDVWEKYRAIVRRARLKLALRDAEVEKEQ